MELRRKLLARSYSTRVADEVLDALEEEKLLEEARFVEQFVNTRVSRGQGPARIRAELMQRGIGEALIQAGLGKAEYDWASLAAAARRKRFGPASPNGFGERARQARFLRTRGFEGEQIQAALDSEVDSQPSVAKVPRGAETGEAPGFCPK